MVDSWVDSTNVPNPYKNHKRSNIPFDQKSADLLQEYNNHFAWQPYVTLKGGVLAETVREIVNNSEDKRFQSSEFIVTGSACERTFFTAITTPSISELQEKLFGKNHPTDIQNEIFLKHQNFIKRSYHGRAQVTKNDVDVMFIPSTITLENQSCLVKTDIPEFYKILIDKSMACYPYWSDCCIEKGGPLFLSATLVKDKLRSFFQQLEEKRTFIVKEGGVSFQVATLFENVTQISFYDVVFGIKCDFWPDCASAWQEQSRTWINNEEKERIRRGGFHIVPKLNEHGDKDLDWRVSFSKAESIISNLPLTHWYAISTWRLAKGLISNQTDETLHPKTVSSYMLKTALFIALDKMPVEYWLDEGNLIKRISRLFEDITAFFREGRFPHYFAADVNLIRRIPSELYPIVVNQLDIIRSKFLDNPVSSIYNNPSTQEHIKFGIYG